MILKFQTLNKKDKIKLTLLKTETKVIFMKEDILKFQKAFSKQQQLQCSSFTFLKI